MQDVAKILQKIGLSEKEASVYLASLDLGANSVQNIAKKANVNRATTYVMIEWLMNKGLMSSYQKGKKQVFTAEPPENLKTLLRSQEHDIRERQDLLNEVFPEIKSLYSLAGEKPSVKFFEGKDGIRAIREDILRDSNRVIENFTPFLSEKNSIFTVEENKQFIETLKKKGFEIKEIYAAESDQYEKDQEKMEFRYIPKERFPLKDEVLIYGRKVALFAVSTNNKALGVIIENETFAQTWRAIHKLAWEGAEKYKRQ